MWWNWRTCSVLSQKRWGTRWAEWNCEPNSKANCSSQADWTQINQSDNGTHWNQSVLQRCHPLVLLSWVSFKFWFPGQGSTMLIWAQLGMHRQNICCVSFDLIIRIGFKNPHWKLNLCLRLTMWGLEELPPWSIANPQRRCRALTKAPSQFLMALPQSSCCSLDIADWSTTVNSLRDNDTSNPKLIFTHGTWAKDGTA